MRFLRLLIFIGLAFIAGMFAERLHQQDLCERSGGEWLRAGFCGAAE